MNVGKHSDGLRSCSCAFLLSIVEAAKEITEQAGVKFTNLVLSEDLYDFMSEIVGFPTTIFVDKDGTIIGDPIVGSNVPATDDYIASVLNGGN